MARKVNPVFPGRFKRREEGTKKSWACVGVDTSMTSIAMCGMGYDGVRKQFSKVAITDCRWSNDIDYFSRLAMASKAYEMVWHVIPPNVARDRIFIAQEEPVPMGMIGGKFGFKSGYIKQQCEVSGAVMGSLARWGYQNLFQINNQQWRKVLRNDGQIIRKGAEGKWDVKEWAIQAYGLPELPDLVATHEGGKMPRPESGKGSNAKAVQPDDCYDAAAVLAWMMDYVEEHNLITD